MITLAHRDGRRIQINITDADARLLSPALASGWAFGRMQQIEAFKPLDESAPPARKPRTIPEPADGVKATVMEFFAVGVKASKRKFKAESGMAVDTADAAIDWLVQAGMLACEGKSYLRTESAK